MNRFVGVGRLVADPELRYTSNGGHAVANFRLAINRPFKNQDGEQEADFINCVAWRKQAENLANYMRKGSQIGVDGRIQTRSYDNDQGQRIFVTEVLAESITFLEPRGNNPEKQDSSQVYQQQVQQNQQTNQSQPNPFEGDAEPVDIGDDELPF